MHSIDHDPEILDHPEILDQDDIEDFCALICGAGLNPYDFELFETVTDFIGPEAGIATVRHKRSGVERSYPIGHGTSFPANFAVDLGQGVFT
jgi:hypothetical protein